jgi:hypothetical protein
MERHTGRWLTGEEELRLLRWRLHGLGTSFYLPFHTGLRMGEVHGLIWSGCRPVPSNHKWPSRRRTATALELLKQKYASRSMETELVFLSEALTRLIPTISAEACMSLSRKPRCELFRCKFSRRPFMPEDWPVRQTYERV